MAKSTRSKVKRSYRAKKREDGVFAATEAARLQRLSAKLAAVRDADVHLTPLNPDEDNVDAVRVGDSAELAAADSMAIDSPTNPASTTQPTSASTPPSTSTSDTPARTKVSTHGARVSRRVEWRVSKGMAAHPKSRGMNRQGGVAAKSRSGRAQRRR